jgi:hypothetical protein
MVVFPPKIINFPENSPKYLNVLIEFPVGPEIEQTTNITEQVEDKVIT